MSNNSGPGYAKHPDHRVTVKPFQGRVIASVGGAVIADTRRALELQESKYPPVYYVPRADAHMDKLSRTTHSTHCPFKGDASYFSIGGGGDERENAVWSYEKPYDEVIAIREHLAFYPDRVDLRIEPEAS